MSLGGRLDALRSWWQGRSPLGQKLAVAGALLAASSLIIGTGAAAYREDAKLERQCRRLAREIDSMRLDAAGIAKAGTASPKALPEGMSFRDAVVRQAQDLGLGELAGSLRLDGQERIQLEADMSFARLVNLQSSLQSSLALRIEELTITPTGSGDTVHVVAAFTRPDS